MYNDRNITRKIKTEIDRMTTLFSQKIRRVENELRIMRTSVSRVSRELDKIKESLDSDLS